MQKKKTENKIKWKREMATRNSIKKMKWNSQKHTSTNTIKQKKKKKKKIRKKKIPFNWGGTNKANKAVKMKLK